MDPERRLVNPAPSATYHTRIEWIDTDAAGIYHNGTVVRFVEAAEALLMERAGVSAEYFSAAPRVHYEVDFFAPLFFAQAVTATVTVAAVGTASITFAFEIWGEAFESRGRCLAARGSYVAVHTVGNHRDGTATSAPWPQQWRDALSN